MSDPQKKNVWPKCKLKEARTISYGDVVKENSKERSMPSQLFFTNSFGWLPHVSCGNSNNIITVISKYA